MNLKELNQNIQSTIKDLQNGRDPKNIEVLITLSESSIGARAFTKVSCVGLGFDWESGQFRIEPQKTIVSKGNTTKNIKSVECKQFKNRNYHFCPRCESKISKNDKFCRYCGQRLK